MAWRGGKWQLITASTVALCLGGAAVGFSQFTSFSDRSRAVLEGNWQTCREGDGQYSERIYDARIPGIGKYEFHMGPYHEFALFRGIQDEHRDHNSAANLLHPYTVDVVSGFGKQKWEAAGLKLEATLAGGSREECESWFVTLKRTETTSH
jgi:hypothetical protein